MPVNLAPFEDDFDAADLPCSICAGEGLIEYIDCPEVWGEDCPSLENHLVLCPRCVGTGWADDAGGG